MWTWTDTMPSEALRATLTFRHLFNSSKTQNPRQCYSIPNPHRCCTPPNPTTSSRSRLCCVQTAQDNNIVRLFREAGAVIVGTTAMTEFGVTPLGPLVQKTKG